MASRFSGSPDLSFGEILSAAPARSLTSAGGCRRLFVTLLRPPSPALSARISRHSTQRSAQPKGPSPQTSNLCTTIPTVPVVHRGPPHEACRQYEREGQLRGRSRDLRSPAV